MKRFIIFFVSIISPLCLIAQQTDRNSDYKSKIDSISARDSLTVTRYQKHRTMRGLKTFVDFGYQWGTGTDDEYGIFANRYNLDKVEASASIGKQFNNFIFLGGGFGLDVFFGHNKVLFGAPVFGNLRVNLLNDKRVMPFLDFRIGYSIGQIDGIYFCGQIGVRYRLSHKYAIFLACQYDLSSSSDLDPDIDAFVDNLGFKVGFEF